MQNIMAQIRGFDKCGVLSPYLESNAADFESSAVSVPKHEEIHEWCRFAGLDAGAEKELMSFASKVLDDKSSSFLYFHCKRLAFDFMRLYPGSEIYKWTFFESVFPGESEMFLLLLAVSMVPNLRRIHQSMNIPLDITRDTCGDVASRIEISREFKNGKVGISLVCLAWLRLHAKGELFQIGRLQFHPVILNEPVCAYRRKSDGKVLIFSEPGQRFKQDGFYDGAGGKLSADAWISRWEEKDGRLTANSFASNGRAQKLPITIVLDEWSLAADSSSAVMNMHIPRGRRISIEDWRDSVSRGFEFFRTVRPASASVVACTCKSWMFDPRLQDLLPENSGLVSIQKRVNLFALPHSGTRNGLYFIFGDDNIDLEKASHDTSLRRAVADYLKTGGSLSGGGILLFEDQIERNFKS